MSIEPAAQTHAPHDQAAEVAHAWHHFGEYALFFAGFLSLVLAAVAQYELSAQENYYWIFFLGSLRFGLIGFFLFTLVRPLFLRGRGHRLHHPLFRRHGLAFDVGFRAPPRRATRSGSTLPPTFTSPDPLAMSLKFVHQVIIFAAIGISLIFGYWCFTDPVAAGNPWFIAGGILSGVAVLALIAYEFYFLRKTRRLILG